LTIAIRKLGHVPLLPTGDAPRYDLGFVRDDGASLVVIEFKSLSDEHAVHQLRLGLGQILHYAHALSLTGRSRRRSRFGQRLRRSGPACAKRRAFS
jgi:hypothetical protein